MTSIRSSRLKSVALLVVAMSVAAFSTACNTVEGAGRDIKAGGKAIEKAAENAKN